MAGNLGGKRDAVERTQKLNVPEIDIAVAWVLAEVTKQGINTTANQIANAAQQAFAVIS